MLNQQKSVGIKASGKHHHVDLPMFRPTAGFPVFIIQPEPFDNFTELQIPIESFHASLHGTPTRKKMRILSDASLQLRDSFKPDRQPQFTEGKALSGAVFQGIVAGKRAQAEQGGIQDGFQKIRITEATHYHQLRHSPGIGQETANAERVIRSQLLSPAYIGYFDYPGVHAGPRPAYDIPGRCRLQLAVGNESIKRIVLPHCEDERIAKIDTQLPVHPLLTISWVKIREPGMRRLRKLQSPSAINGVSGNPADAA
jgi:hypothetical protein